MPIYEYECSNCRSRFERKQRFDEEPVASWPKCSGKARRLIHSVPVIFKGSGFYCTDHGGASCNSAGKCPEPECKAKTETTKTETKKEAKKEAKTEEKS